MSSGPGLVVKSHVARDLMQNAALFKTDKLVVWEYVSNGLQYVDLGTSPVVRVSLDSKRKCISIQDNGRGMDWSGLQNFFVMHGENLDRRQGKPGRGRFGTGKSAAFGIADVLRVSTVRNELCQSVELTRHAIESMGEGTEIPVTILKKDSPSKSPNGTLIEVEVVHLKSLDQAGIINYIERHLAHWPKNCSVIVNNHECEYSDPPVAHERRFRAEGSLLEKLGDVDLTVKVSKVPLDAELRGISIYANGVWHETTLAGSEGRDMAQYLFGELDVPRLEEDTSPIAPFDLSRSMRLNPSNELVQFIYAFINRSVEQVRKELVDSEKNRKASEEARKLAEQGSEIARLLNEDFEAFRQRVAKVRAKARGAVDSAVGLEFGAEQNGDLLLGGDQNSRITDQVGGPGSMGDGVRSGGDERRQMLPLVTPDAAG